MTAQNVTPSPDRDFEPLTADELAELKKLASRAKAQKSTLVVRYTQRGEQLAEAFPPGYFSRTAS